MKSFKRASICTAEDCPSVHTVAHASTHWNLTGTGNSRRNQVGSRTSIRKHVQVLFIGFQKVIFAKIRYNHLTFLKKH